MKIFSGSSSKLLSGAIVKHLGIDLSPIEIFVFPDGEKRIRIGEKVLGQDAVVIESTGMPSDQNYMELFLIIDALKRSGAASIKVIVPYLGYQRQDHIFRDGEGVSLDVVTKILEQLGTSELFSFDLHSAKIPEIFTIPAHNLSALSLFAEKIKKDFNHAEIILVSPDMGGIRRIKEISEMLDNLPYVTINKNRDLDTGDIKDSQLNGDVRGKTALIIDDIISTGATIVEGANLLLENGATRVFAFATHGVLAGDASSILEKSKIERIIITDTIEVSKENQFPKLQILSIAQIAAKALKT